MDVDKQIESIRTGDTIMVNGKYRAKVLSNHGRSGILLRESPGVTYAIRFSACSDRWWFGLSGHEDILVTSVVR